MSAARVMAAGSVMSEPSNGTSPSPSQAIPTLARMGMRPATHCRAVRTDSSTGREAATTITTHTNNGSVNWRDSA